MSQDNIYLPLGSKYSTKQTSWFIVPLEFTSNCHPVSSKWSSYITHWTTHSPDEMFDWVHIEAVCYLGWFSWRYLILNHFPPWMSWGSVQVTLWVQPASWDSGWMQDPLSCSWALLPHVGLWPQDDVTSWQKAAGTVVSGWMVKRSFYLSSINPLLMTWTGFAASSMG